jgi:hypothetical protein
MSLEIDDDALAETGMRHALADTPGNPAVEALRGALGVRVGPPAIGIPGQPERLAPALPLATTALAFPGAAIAFAPGAPATAQRNPRRQPLQRVLGQFFEEARRRL